MRCAIWHHLYNLNKREKHPWRSVDFSKVASCTKINTPPWVFFTFFKLYKWQQIAQRTTNIVWAGLITSPVISNVVFTSTHVFQDSFSKNEFTTTKIHNLNLNPLNLSHQLTKFLKLFTTLVIFTNFGTRRIWWW